MSKILSVSALVMLVGCSISETKYSDDSTSAYCDWAVACADPAPASKDQCVTDTTAAQPDTTNCTYDAKVAGDCLDEWTAVGVDCAATLPTCNPYTCTDADTDTDTDADADTDADTDTDTDADAF